MDAAQQAEAQGDFGSAKRWYTEAATLGDVDAMRALIDEYDEHNLFQHWVWVFLSELLGHDLRESSPTPPGRRLEGEEDVKRL